MPESERVFAVARDWVGKAENDFINAVHTLKLGADGPTDTVCFHCQQCVEKYLKALLVLRAVALARRVRREIRRVLPREILRRKMR